jgi:hypothetical protein
MDNQVTFGPFPEEDFNTAIQCFERVMPIPQIQEVIDNEPQFNEDKTPKMVGECDSIQNIKNFLALVFTRKCEKGYNQLLIDGNPMDQELIQRLKDNI